MFRGNFTHYRCFLANNDVWQALVWRESPRTREQMSFGMPATARGRYVKYQRSKELPLAITQLQRESQDMRFLWQVSTQVEELYSTLCKRLPCFL